MPARTAQLTLGLQQNGKAHTQDTVNGSDWQGEGVGNQSSRQQEQGVRGRAGLGLIMQDQPQLNPATSRDLRAAGTVVHTTHATASRVVKGEDVLCVHEVKFGLSPTQPPSMLYLVCDGHCGVEAANFVATNFMALLEKRLPAQLPNFDQTQEVEVFAEHLRKALCEVFWNLDNLWSEAANFAGTTVTVLLVTSWLVTLANVGDSAAVLDTGTSILELTKSHRIQSNMEEQARLKKAAQCLAPLGFHLQGPAHPGEPGVGPLRLWPGGLCVSRSVGDLDAGSEVLPVPHIRQVIIPSEGCRVIMASDGLWDVLSYTKALKLTRSKPTGAAASTLVTAVSRDLRTLDDASIIVVDLLASATEHFPTVVLRANPMAGETGKKNGGLFSCFRPEPVEPDSREASAGSTGHLSFYVDVDCLIAYPLVRQKLLRTNGLGKGVLQAAQRSTAVDYTMHGVMASNGGSLHSPGSGLGRLMQTDCRNSSLGSSAGQADAGPYLISPDEREESLYS